MASKEATAAARNFYEHLQEHQHVANLEQRFIDDLALAFEDFAVGERSLYAQARAGIEVLKKEMAREGVDMSRPIAELWKDLVLERDRLKFRAELLQELIDRVLFGREKRKQELLPPAYQEDCD